MTTRFDNPLDYWGENNRNFLEDKGFGGSIEPGARAATLVIDLSRAFTDPTTPVGSDLEEVVRNNERILRSRDAHEASLHDLQAKNGEVVSTADVAAYLEGLRAGRGASRQRGGE